MTNQLTDFERRLVAVATAAAPELDDDQGVVIKRTLKPYLTIPTVKDDMAEARRARRQMPRRAVA